MRYDIDSLENRDLGFIDRLLWFVERVIVPYHRAEVHGIERIPAGPALYVGNHNALAYTPDSFIFGAAAFRAHGIGAMPYGLGHELAISLPLVHELVVPLGAVRASHDNAMRIFAEGHKVLVYPGGDFDAMRPFRHRDRIVFGGRRGYVRLALRAGVPIVPIVAQGAQSTLVVIDDLRWLPRLTGLDRLLRVKVWPICLAMPWGLVALPMFPYLPFPSKIRIEVMEPVRFERTGDDAAADEDYVAGCATRVETAMQETLTRLAAR